LLADKENKMWYEDLSIVNLIAVYDVVLDINEELQLSAGNRVLIPLWQQRLKFEELMPSDGINWRDRYCELRWKASKLLKSKGYVGDVEWVDSGTHRWQSDISIVVDKDNISKLKIELDGEFKKRDQSMLPINSTPKKENEKIELLKVILNRFHEVVVQLRHRYNDRTTLDVEDEYDVQDILHALLRIHFDDIRPEENTPSYASKTSRVDFYLKNEKTMIEVKKTRGGLGAKEIGDELIIDIERYSKIEKCDTLICFIYDPDNRITNPRGFEADLSGKRDKLLVEVIVIPKLSG
jgi:ribosomal protein S8